MPLEPNVHSCVTSFENCISYTRWYIAAVVAMMTSRSSPMTYVRLYIFAYSSALKLPCPIASSTSIYQQSFTCMPSDARPWRVATQSVKRFGTFQCLQTYIYIQQWLEHGLYMYLFHSLSLSSTVYTGSDRFSSHSRRCPRADTDRDSCNSH